jgi:hypothetical protein
MFVYHCYPNLLGGIFENIISSNAFSSECLAHRKGVHSFLNQMHYNIHTEGTVHIKQQNQFGKISWNLVKYAISFLHVPNFSVVFSTYFLSASIFLFSILQLYRNK